MAKQIHKDRRKALTVVAHKAKAGRSACVMKPEYLAEIERFRLMDDDFMSKCLEHAPECIELILRIILGKKDLKVVKSQTEYPIKSLQGRGVRFDVFRAGFRGQGIRHRDPTRRQGRGAEARAVQLRAAGRERAQVGRGF